MNQKLPKQIEVIRLYFAFPDGIFHYVCSECTALCCRRGLGFQGSLQREIKPLLTIYSELGSMAVARQGNIISFTTPEGRCFFLDSDNLCRIEKAHGNSLKPGVCGLYPFNKFTRIGDVIAVSPDFRCPLRLQIPPRVGEVTGTHTSLEVAVKDSALLDREYVNTYMPPLQLHPSLDADSVLDREIDFRDNCSEALGKSAFAETLWAESTDVTGLGAFIERAARIMGCEAQLYRVKRDSTSDLLLAIAPPFRLYLQHLSSEGILRALAMGEVLLRRVLSLSPYPLTLQAAHKILTSAVPVLSLLARGDEAIELGKDANTSSPQFGDSGLVFATIIAMRELQQASKIFDALEKAMNPAMSVTERTILLNHLGARVGWAAKRY